MSGSVNRVILIGNLGRDPEVRYTKTGMAVANFSLATNRRKKVADGEYENEVQWHRIVCFSKNAEFASQYLRKGAKIYVDGELIYNTFVDKEGQQRTIAEIHCRDIGALQFTNDINTKTQKKDNDIPTSNTVVDDIPF